MRWKSSNIEIDLQRHLNFLVFRQMKDFEVDHLCLWDDFLQNLF